MVCTLCTCIHMHVVHYTCTCISLPFLFLSLISLLSLCLPLPLSLFIPLSLNSSPLLTPSLPFFLPFSLPFSLPSLPPSLPPQVVNLGLCGVFTILEEIWQTNPELCHRVLAEFLNILQGQAPGGLKNEPIQSTGNKVEEEK